MSTVLVSKEKKEAETQGQQARHAVQMLTKVADIGFDDQLDPLQKEFLEDALQYYEQFTSRVAHDPAVRLEHGRVYQQMGDIQRKLGDCRNRNKPTEGDRNPGATGEPCKSAGPSRGGHWPVPARLLADLLVRSGGDKDKAEPLYGKALDAQQALARLRRPPPRSFRLGQTLKSQGDLCAQWSVRPRQGGLRSSDRRARSRHVAADAKHSEIRNDLALATDARGWIYRELGDAKACRSETTGALTLLDALVAEFPTVPRYRESLARRATAWE